LWPRRRRRQRRSCIGRCNLREQTVAYTAEKEAKKAAKAAAEADKEAEKEAKKAAKAAAKKAAKAAAKAEKEAKKAAEVEKAGFSPQVDADVYEEASETPTRAVKRARYSSVSPHDSSRHIATDDDVDNVCREL
jgi:membrane protein involved in colicin uptake